MKNNKTLLALLLVAIVGVVGLTIAYFSNSSSVSNEFKTNSYGTTVEEVFESPDNWLPGTTTPKTLTVTNSGSVDEAVRVSYVETWTSKNGGNLPLSQNGNTAAIINWSNTNEWTTITENGTVYKYYNYKLAPTEVTSSILESVTFNSAITNDSNCVTNEANGTKTITCNSTGNGYDGATYRLVFTVETIQYDKYQEAWGTNVAILEEKPQPVIPVAEVSGVEKLATTATNAANAEFNADTKGKMFTFTHELNGNTVNESRYIGDAPNNYVYFNCTDDNDTATCEVWRILGTFEVERTDPSDSTKTITETRMKLVRGSDFATTMQWDNRNSEQYSSGNYGKNDWNGSVMNTYLNGDYYNSMSTTAQSQIEDAIYYLGGRTYDSTTHYGSTEEIYAWERGTTVYNSTRPTEWEGKVALMYPSDMYMTYGKGVDNNCYNDPNKCYTGASPAGTPTKSWIYNTNKLEGNSNYQWTWLLSPFSGSSRSVFLANSDGRLNRIGADDAGGGRPVVYLKSDIKIARGTGEVGSPYELE